MKIEKAELWTDNLDGVLPFYAHTLSLPLLSHSAASAEFQVGASRLVLRQLQPTSNGHYHLAFDVPENQFQHAVEWLQSRTQPAANLTGKVIFDHSGWNAHSIYFKDPDGNILELIARHNQPNASQADFSVSSLLSISEFGLAVEDVPAAVQTLSAALAESVYDGAGSQEFTALGNELGLMILVRRGRIWMPGTGKAAEPVPFRLQARNRQGRSFEMFAPPYPFTIQEYPASAGI